MLCVLEFLLGFFDISGVFGALGEFLGWSEVEEEVEEVRLGFCLGTLRVDIVQFWWGCSLSWDCGTRKIVWLALVTFVL